MHACPSDNHSYHLREIAQERACLVRISVNLQVHMRSHLFVQQYGKLCVFVNDPIESFSEITLETYEISSNFTQDMYVFTMPRYVNYRSQINTCQCV